MIDNQLLDGISKQRRANFWEKYQTVISDSSNRLLQRFIFQTVAQKQEGVEWL